MKEATHTDSSQDKEILIPELLKFDLRVLALEKLKYAANGSVFLKYKQARCVLGRSLHLPKQQARKLLLQMAHDGLIKFNVKGKIIFLEEAENE